MMQELPSPQCRSYDSPQTANHPAGRRTCDLSVDPKPPHPERTKRGPDLKLHNYTVTQNRYSIKRGPEMDLLL